MRRPDAVQPEDLESEPDDQLRRLGRVPVAPTIGADAVTDAGAPVPLGVDPQADHPDEFATVDDFDAELVLAAWHLMRFIDDRIQPGSLLVTSRLVSRQESKELWSRGPTPRCLEVVDVDLTHSNPLAFD